MAGTSPMRGIQAPAFLGQGGKQIILSQEDFLAFLKVFIVSSLCLRFIYLAFVGPDYLSHSAMFVDIMDDMCIC